MQKLNKGQIKGVSREMRKIISKMDITEEEYYSEDGYFAPMDISSAIEENCKDLEFAELWAARCFERELRRAVKEERQKQNLTQAELAKKAHITQQQLSRFEVGENNHPSLSTVSKVLHALNLEIKFIPRTKTHKI